MGHDIKTTHKIDYLVARRFPTALALRLPSLNRPRSNITAERRAEILSQSNNYRRDLEAKDPTEIDALHSAEKQAEYAQLRTKADLEESQRFFNQPSANADFKYWAKAAYWSLEEALSLSFGRNPARVTPKALQSSQGFSPFATEYFQRYNLMQRAKGVSQLGSSVFPGNFLAWLKRNALSYPPELEAAFVENGGVVADWQSLYEQAKALLDEKTVHCTKLEEQINNLTTALESKIIETHKPPDTKNAKLGTRERETLLKMVIGMAVAFYGYEPGKRFNKAGELRSDLESKGISLDADTIRKWLARMTLAQSFISFTVLAPRSLHLARQFLPA